MSDPIRYSVPARLRFSRASLLRSSSATVVLTAAGLLLAAATAHAQSTWDGETSTDWNTATNWTNNTYPANADATVNPGGTPNPIPTIATNAATVNDILVNTTAAGTATVNQSGGAITMGANGGWFRIATASGGTGIYNLTGGSLTQAVVSDNQRFTVGETGSGQFNMSGGTVNTNAIVAISRESNSTGLMTMTGGTFTAGREFWVSASPNTQGTVNISNGTLAVGTWLAVGRGGNNGNLNLSGGAVTVATAAGTNANITVAGSATTAVGQITVSGGTLSTPRNLWIGENGAGTVTVNGTGLVSIDGTDGGGVQFGHTTTSVGTFHLNGGTLRAKLVSQAVSTASGTFNFNGGLLQATQSSATYMGGLTLANVRNGGAHIDTQAFNIGISQPLLHSAISGDAATDGGLIKDGTGVLAITGANTYTGPTLVNGGALIGGTLASLPGWNAGRITLAAGTALGGQLGADFTPADFTSLLSGFTFPAGTSVAIDTTKGDVTYTSDLGTATNLGTAVSLLKAGANSLILDPSGQTFTGGIRSTAGTVVLQTSANTTYSGNMTGGQALTVQGDFVLNLDGASAVGLFSKLGNGTLNFTGGTLAQGGTFDSRAGTVNQNAGTITSTGEFWIGQAAGASVVYNLSDTAQINASNWFVVGRETGAGVLNLTGGAITKTNAANNIVLGSLSGNGVVNQSGGTVTNTASATWLGENENAAAVWNQTGGTNTFALLRLGTGGGSTGTATYNLDGGSVTATKVDTNWAGASTFNFNGGTLRASASDTLYMSSASLLVNVRNGGAIVDTQANNIAILSNLGHSVLAGDAAIDGGLTKRGSGTLSLGGFNDYTGPTVIAEGTLNPATSSSLPGYNVAGRVTIAPGGTLSLGSGWDDSEVNAVFSTIIFPAGSSYGYDTGGVNSTFDRTLPAGVGLSKLGDGVLTLGKAFTGPLAIGGGSLDLGGISLPGVTSLTLGGGILDNTVGNSSSVILSSTGTAILITGNYLAATPAITANVPLGLTGATGGSIRKTTNLGSTTLAGSLDLGGVTRTIAIQDSAQDIVELGLTGVVSNGGIVLDNAADGTSTQDWGTLALTAANSYSGPTTLTKGRVVITDPLSLGTTGGATIIGEHGTLALGGAGLTIPTGIDVAENLTLNARTAGEYGVTAIQNNSGANTLSGTIVLTAPATLETQGGALTISGAITETTPASGLTKIGANGVSLTLSGNNSFTGNVVVTNGSLIVTNSGALGTGTKTISVNNGTAGATDLRLDGTAGNLSLPATFTYELSNVAGSIINVAGANTLGGKINITLGGGAAVLQSDAGSLAVSADVTATVVDRALVLQGAADGSVSGVISNGASAALTVTKLGTGTWTLSGANSYTGRTTVSAGILSLAAANTLADASTVQVDGTGVLNLNFSGSDTVAGLTIGNTVLPAGTYNATTHPGVITGGGNLIVGVPASTPFSDYIASFPSVPANLRGPNDDPDGDGVSNLLEFAFKGDPSQPGSRGLMAVLAADTNANTTRELTLTVAVRNGATFTGSPALTSTVVDGVVYKIEGSTDLATFGTIVTEAATPLPAATTGLPDLTGTGWVYKTFVLSGSESLTGKGFLRAGASQP